jgi:hypothetical protein
MGQCIYCGTSAGLFRKKHKECESKHLEARGLIVSRVREAFIKDSSFAPMEKEVQTWAASGHVKQEEIPTLYAEGLESAVEAYLEDGVLTKEEENRLADFQSKQPFDRSLADKKGTLVKVVKAAILREILDGEVPDPRVNVNGQLPFLFQKSEKLIWVFPKVEFYEQRTRTTYHGRSQGASIRIAKGLYYRTGSFKGHPVRVDEMTHIDRGIIALTSKHLYFGSSAKNFKVPFNKLVTLEPFEDGIGLQKDGASTKPQIFKGLDGWFAFNVISNLRND